MKWTKVLFFILISSVLAQGQKYFQQDVSYTINATLNDSTQLLTGSVAIDYTHQGTAPLKEVYLHLWANSFKNNQTHYAADQIKRKKRGYYFAPESDRGGYQKMDLTIAGVPQVLNPVDGYDDVVKIDLATHLAQGQKVEMKMEFDLKIPKMFSRLGHHEGTYHFTHWYPRVAVYDKKGWHPIHYGLGEFYGDYSSYQVALTVPSDYRIDFTGSGVAGLPSQHTQSTTSWAITAENVHDFAWVASKDYHTDFGKVESIDGHEILLTVLRRKDYRSYWSEALLLLKESLEYYEKEVGPYAYDKIVLVQDVVNGDMNMEYPGLIIVGDRGNKKSLEYYINHELGHQWFYGALGFNEYEEPWLDEGLTTFYEQRYTMRKHGVSHYADMSGSFFQNRDNLEPIHAAAIANNACHCHQRADTPLPEMRTVNYGFRNYGMAARYYQYLEKYIGRPVFDEGMKSFYTLWKFKHPSTADLQKHLEEQSGKELDWFFKELLVTDTNADFSLKKYNTDQAGANVTLENKTGLAVPVYLSYYKEGTMTGGQWVEPFADKTEIALSQSDLTNVDQIKVDGENLLFDTNRNNNQIKTKGLFKKIEPLRLSAFNSTDPSSETNLFLALLAGFNTSDGFHFGPGILNSTLPPQKIQFEAFPYYALESKSVVGHGRLGYDHYFKEGKIRGLELALNYKTYHFSDFDGDFFWPGFEANLRYQRWVPSIGFSFRHEPLSGISSGISLRNIRLYEDVLAFSDIDDEPTKVLNNNDIQELSYSRKKENALIKNQMRIALEHQAYSDPFREDEKRYLKLTGEFGKEIYFAERKRVNIRLFGAGFLMNTERESSSYNSILTRGSIPLFAGGHNDYRYDGQFMTRGDQDEKQFFKNQIGRFGGGFKNALGSAYNLGYSNDYAIALNVTTDLPFNLPSVLGSLKPFFDTGYYSTKSFTSDPLEGKVLYSAGLTLDMNVLKIHFPLIQSKDITDIYKAEDQNILERITFSVNIPRFDYKSMVEFLDF